MALPSPLAAAKNANPLDSTRSSNALLQRPEHDGELLKSALEVASTEPNLLMQRTEQPEAILTEMSGARRMKVPMKPRNGYEDEMKLKLKQSS